MTSIKTERLELIPFAEEHYQAIFVNDNHKLGKLLGCEPPESWTEYDDAKEALPILYKFFMDLNGDWRWGSFFIKYDNQLAGNCGFKGKPDTNNCVEIGYEIHPNFQNKGLATEAACALVKIALEAGVITVKAHTFELANASAHVLKKAGFHSTGPVHDPDEGLVWAWSLHNSTK
ncbi:GNAT family protein [Cytophagaceae bacterium YF14B1]|uniref:GNAT family protein n=1 Tax=Xanthocytophaga flava TaxID=3048013 RepID=A0AAE3U8C0_9BACT|nr:GNAT family protein [Xanthocytophaga flavus]MDJ1480529.1 GNAT family protein [Xanthocytophaga flavus]